MSLGPNMPSFIKGVAAANVVFKLLENSTDQNEDITNEIEPVPAACDGHIDLRDLSFIYPSRPDRNALSGINLEFPKGTSTAIVGPSGAGKSTLISLLERWYEPTTGTILVDGRDISRLSFKWLRRQIALVQQEPQLFNASIFDNIAYGLVGTPQENVSYQEKMRLVKEACQDARAYEFISKLPKVRSTQYVLFFLSAHRQLGI
jgi:ATP-binding cassette, subfamily B (MDR/TAP), member 1